MADALGGEAQGGVAQGGVVGLVKSRRAESPDGDAHAAATAFTVEALPSTELDPTYQCDDVAVWRLLLKATPTPPSSGKVRPRDAQ